ncbi:MAG: ABC transporter permease [Arenicellales bacterium]|nr:ABC transporter permease [Arenicellales bacterium]
MAQDLMRQRLGHQEKGSIQIEHPLKEMARMFATNYAAVAGLVVLVIIVVVSMLGPFIYTVDPWEMVWAPFSPPGAKGFLLGTDYLGRDLVAQIIHGGRATIAVGCAAALLSVLIGITFGALSGFYRGWVEELLMKITEFFQVLPTLLFSMVLVALFGASLQMITFAIGIVSWTGVARVTRAEFLKIRELEFVTASRSGGAKAPTLIFRVILPNALPPIVVQSALLVGFAILFEAGLSFLGLSDPDVMSWGAMMGNNRPYILQHAFTIMYPGLAIFITVLAISLVGDGLNDALNPKLRKR